MSITFSERVGKGLESFKKGLKPFIEREMKDAYGDAWPAQVYNFLRENHSYVDANKEFGDDVHQLLVLMWAAWHEVFRKTLGHTERSYVSELREVRNRWAHQERFSSDDAQRALDTMARLLNAISAPEAQELEQQRYELLRLKFEEQSRNERRKVASSHVEGAPPPSLKPWREVVNPHQDVISNRFAQAEFAADLWQVYKAEGSSPEYQDPQEFFRRTFMTEGLKGLLSNALKRLSAQGGDPVVELQTNFGGGKTHAMLALYHLFSDNDYKFHGLEDILRASQQLPKNVRRVVLVENKISSGQPDFKADGSKVCTRVWVSLPINLVAKLLLK
ncbi:MAG: Swt1 family HEPN domain-containing protein [Deinococcales bacterium]